MVASDRSPRRMSSVDRRDHLVAAATSEVAACGYAACSLDAVAGRADVTRNLLYHYFPRGRHDLFVAVADRAGQELTDDWVTDGQVALPERMMANFARLAEHAAEPSDAWRVFRQGRAAADPDIRRITDAYLDRVVASVALNQLGTIDQSPLARMALRAFIAYTEVALEDARDHGLPSDTVLALLADTLVATVEAVRRL